jgi:hypothetical protein
MQLPFVALTAQAATSSWLRGASIQPTSTTDFGSAAFQQSLQNLKATGATYVSLIVPYYQSDQQSSDIGNGYNTPTDAALGSAIDYAHSIGLAVALKAHNETYTGAWRAYIAPSDRNTWFSNFNNELVHLAQLGQAHHAEMIVLGTEMVSVASSKVNGDNTQRWQGIIGNVRKVFNGKLTYDANSTNNNGDPFEDEKESIGFWGSLDYVGLSIYYNLNTDGSVQSLTNQWSYWDNNDLKAFQQRVGKQLLFTEIGYRSVDGAHYAPWDSGRGGGYNPSEQANDYEALFSYWNNSPYVAGIFIWDWQSNPSGGGSGNTDYTVQNKPAQQTILKWFGTSAPPSNGGGESTTPPPAAAPGVSMSASAPATAQQNTAVSISGSVTNTGGTVTGAIVDIEVYNQAGSKIFQQSFDNQTLTNGQSKSYTATWPGAGPRTYHVAVGVFNNNWTQNYFWNGSAANITLQTSITPPPNTPPPSNPPPANNPPASAVTYIWWPSNGGTVNGVQPFKAMLEGVDVTQYTMYWQVDGGALNTMGNNSTDYPHKESDVDVSGWNWSATHTYTLNFVSKNSSGAVISQKSETIKVQ